MITTNRKSRRGDNYRLGRSQRKASPLATLNNEQHQQLCFWLLRTRMTYPDISLKIKEEWGLHVTDTILSNYYTKNVAQYLITQRQRNIDVVTEVNSDLAKNPAEFVPASLDSLKRMAWMLSNDPVPDPKAIKIVFELILRFGEQDIRRKLLSVRNRKVDLLEKKHRQAELAARDSKLSDTDFAERMRKIFRRDENVIKNVQSKEEAPNGNRVTS